MEHSQIVDDQHLPALIIPINDYHRLVSLANAASRHLPGLALRLAEELERADVCSADLVPREIVTMNSRVALRNLHTGAVRTVTLVYPEKADIAANNISVLTPIGTALIGLAAGDVIDWTTPEGDDRQLTVLKVEQGARA